MGKEELTTNAGVPVADGTTAKIVIFGAGISGLSAAHELTQLGYSVSVYETADEPGGFLQELPG